MKVKSVYRCFCNKLRQMCVGLSDEELLDLPSVIGCTQEEFDEWLSTNDYNITITIDQLANTCAAFDVSADEFIKTNEISLVQKSIAEMLNMGDSVKLSFAIPAIAEYLDLDLDDVCEEIINLLETGVINIKGGIIYGGNMD